MQNAADSKLSGTLRGNMMESQLLVIDLLDFGRKTFPQQEIVSRRLEGDIHRYTYADCWRRTSQLGHVLNALGVQAGDCVATLAWNTYRHMELYYAVSGVGAVLHTVNPRLFSEQIEYIINHAEDRYVFVDLGFVALLEEIQERLPTVRGYIILTDEANMPSTSLPNVLCYETLLHGQEEHYAWPRFDENSAASLCYTSG